MSRALSWFLLGSLVIAGCDYYHAGGDCSQGDAICDSTGFLLSCEAGTFVDLHCDGPDGCTDNDECDDSIAQDGERCSYSEDGNYACAPDGAGELQCQNGSWTTIDSCPDGQSCATTGDTVSCH